MKTCPYCAEKIQDKAVKCRFCGEFLTTLPDDKGKQIAQAKPEPRQQQKTHTPPQTEKSGTEAMHPGKSAPSFKDKGIKPPLKPAETVSGEIRETIGSETAGVPLERPETAKKKKDWVLIIAIIVFGILLLVIQFSKQLGIEGFP